MRRAADRALDDLFAQFNPPTDEVATPCTLTLLCVDGDGHPCDAGYAA
jgi:hypothetical protein